MMSDITKKNIKLKAGKIIIIGLSLLLILPIIFSYSILGQAGLVILAPSSVGEGEQFQITVTSIDGGFPIENAAITVEWDEYVTYTNSTGKALLTAPLVDQDESFTITATYNKQSTQTNITVENTPPEEKLGISAPSSVWENQSFDVLVTVNSIPIENAIVSVEWHTFTYFTNENGIVNLTAPMVNEDIYYTISVTKEGYLPNSVLIAVLNNEIPPEPQLEISAPSSVWENESFEVVVTANSNPIENVMVSVDWNNCTYFTNEHGIVNLTAPIVDDDSNYTISATKEGYLPDTVWITILNLEGEQDGYVYGVVYDNTSMLLEDVLVCIIVSYVNNQATKRCVFTNTAGSYTMLIPPGTYNMEVSKDDYITKTAEGILVNANEYTRVDFTLMKETEDGSKSIVEEPIFYAMESWVKEGRIGGEITIYEDGSRGIILHNQVVNIENVSTSEKGTISYNIAGPDGAPGTVVSLYGDQTILSDSKGLNLNNIVVEFDGVKIEMAASPDDIFSPDNTEPIWVGLITKEGFFILVAIPHFSEHTITITSIIDTISGLNAILIYIAFCIVTLIAATIHMKFIWKR